jgi:hypothetical protein
MDSVQRGFDVWSTRCLLHRAVHRPVHWRDNADNEPSQPLSRVVHQMWYVYYAVTRLDTLLHTGSRHSSGSCAVLCFLSFGVCSFLPAEDIIVKSLSLLRFFPLMLACREGSPVRRVFSSSHECSDTDIGISASVSMISTVLRLCDACCARNDSLFAKPQASNFGFHHGFHHLRDPGKSRCLASEA